MSDRAVVAVAADTGWCLGETTWDDDRTRPTDGWRKVTGDPPDCGSFRDVVDWVDFARFEGVYRAWNDRWTPFLACWLAIAPALGERVQNPRGDGAVVAVQSARDAAALRTWFRGAKVSVADGVRSERISMATARQRLLDGLRRRTDDRELIVGARAHE